jgi:hypothetical protein
LDLLSLVFLIEDGTKKLGELDERIKKSAYL